MFVCLVGWLLVCVGARVRSYLLVCLFDYSCFLILFRFSHVFSIFGISILGTTVILLVNVLRSSVLEDSSKFIGNRHINAIGHLQSYTAKTRQTRK